ncbi:amino acid transport protein related protein [Thermoplasma acidophilum]|uniref:Amino acid transport protein related protein n=1 Tax=Thermoplasma acidophilum (strain ATCC 25905 / DSM 1728 / JCM 9062 / NBRC 15155 / AMRC-C165) TaxID=273075 RepID=Q9HK19_THEAC|nr:APC family permease [Thermoplasma acidophilum]CAC11920.1 amino acid transport protein related protein [Thermoplasma acidophilum]
MMNEDTNFGNAKLRRSLGMWDLFFLSITGMIGSGWLFAALDAADYVGPASIFTWIIAALFFFVIALTYAELSGIIPYSGSIVRFNQYSHGSMSNFLIGWAYLIGAVSTVTVEAISVVTYTSTYMPQFYNSSAGVLTPLGILVSIVLIGFFFFIQFIGVNVYGKLNTIMTAWKLAIPVITVVLIMSLSFNPRNFYVAHGFLPYGSAAIFAALIPSGVVYAFEGFRQGIEYAGEARNPQRDVPISLIAAMLATIGIYVALEIAFIGSIKWGAIGISPGDWAALSTSSWASGPFYYATKYSGVLILSVFAVVILIDAFISPFASLGVYEGTSARSFYGMARLNVIPEFFGSIHPRFRTPWVGLIFTLILSSLFLAPFPSWYLIVGINASFTVYAYLSAGITNTVIRKNAPDIHRPFRLPAASVLSPIAFVVASMLVYWSGFSIIDFLILVVYAGLPLILLSKFREKLNLSLRASIIISAVYWILIAVVGFSGYTGRLPFVYYWPLISAIPSATFAYAYLKSRSIEIVSSVWIIVYNILIGAVSYYGSLGTGVIAYPYDYAIFAVISLGIYFLAVRTGYSTEELKNLVTYGPVAE